MKLESLDQREFNPYYQTYIEKVNPQRSLMEALTLGKKEAVVFFESLAPSVWDYAYAAGKWTPKQKVLHLIDTERIFAYRALRFGRNDLTALPGFDQDHYVAVSAANARSSASLIAEYKAVRDATIALFENLRNQDLSVIGSASGGPFSPRALAFVIAGHEIHHIELIKEKYQ